jgi:lysophospholipase L1-like esterase
MMNKIACFLILSVLCVGCLYGAEKEVSRWEKDISTFEQWDAKNSFPADPVLFVGSSSIRMWRTSESFPNLPVINRGFGGSQTSDAVEFAHRIVLPYKPKLIVFYEGDNDIAKGKTPQQVLADYKQFVKIVHDKLPRTPILFMSIKPSGSRWSIWPTMAKANSLIKDYSAKDTRLFYIDGAIPLLGKDGKPDDKFYISDKLHLSAEGYKIWTQLLAPITEIYNVDLTEKSLALFLISKGMGPHNLSPEKQKSLTFEKGQSSKDGSARQATQAGTYIASKGSKVFHTANCRFVATMSQKNKLTFPTRESAVQTGRRPCMRCNP